MTLLAAQRILIPPDFDIWRTHARKALLHSTSPEAIDFIDATHPATEALFANEPQTENNVPAATRLHVPKSFLDQATVAATHRDPQRWNLLYRLLYRMQREPNLLRIEVDADVAEFHRLRQQVAHDLHKMHAFLRFRRMDDEAGEHFIAWYKPAHRILELALPFFIERFTIMRWSILTPDGSASWSPATKQLQRGPATTIDEAPTEDVLEDLWRTYYGSIFNPARLNPDLMRSHMPVKYWQNLPEVTILPQLLQSADTRVATMVEAQKAKPSAAPFVPAKHTLPLLREALPACKGCDLYCHATQAVPGSGPTHAPIMLIGEQPGDQEDLQGLPFVGPAGQLLRKAMAEAGLNESGVYMTNAVKHFKFTPRGKLRLHQNPRLSEIMACRPWLLAEIDALQPRIILCLGASATRSLLGGTFALMRERGKPHSTPFADNVMATVHPSAVLRGRDAATKEQLYRYLRDDLEAVRRFAASPLPSPHHAEAISSPVVEIDRNPAPARRSTR